MRTADQYCIMAENAMDKCEQAQESGNEDAAHLHLLASRIFSNLAIAAAQIEAIRGQIS